MKAKKTFMQKMHHDNSWGDGKQRLEDRFFANGSDESGLEQY